MRQILSFYSIGKFSTDISYICMQLYLGSCISSLSFVMLDMILPVGDFALHEIRSERKKILIHSKKEVIYYCHNYKEYHEKQNKYQSN
jgi:hypothetical protein